MKFKKYEEYCDQVNNIFFNLSCELELILPGARIEHIGSTSIPGSISKGDLDVFVGVDRLLFEQSLVLIKSLNFTEKLGTFRSDQLCMLITDKYKYDVAIQLVSNGSEFEDFIKFRDLLKNNCEFLKEYNLLKQNSQLLNENEYRQLKNYFINEKLKI